MSLAREKFAPHLDSKILEAVRSLAVAEGRPLQSLVEEALTDLLEKHKKPNPRAHVMKAYPATKSTLLCTRSSPNEDAFR